MFLTQLGLGNNIQNAAEIANDEVRDDPIGRRTHAWRVFGNNWYVPFPR